MPSYNDHVVLIGLQENSGGEALKSVETKVLTHGRHGRCLAGVHGISMESCAKR